MGKKKTKARARRSNGQMARDRKIIAKMYLRGSLQAEIAERLGLSQGTISNDIKALQKLWLNSSLMDFNEARSRELAKIDDLEMEYWLAWEASKQDAQTITEEGSELKTGVKTLFRTKTEGQVGDPRFLAGVQWCIKKRAELLGLDAPGRFDITSSGEQIKSDVITIIEYPNS